LTKAIAVAAEPLQKYEYARQGKKILEVNSSANPETTEKGDPTMAYSTVKEIIEKMPTVFDANAAKGTNCVFQFNISGDDGGMWNITVKDGTCELAEGAHAAPSVSLTMSATTWLSIVNKKMNAMQASMSGRLKTVGNMMTAQKIPTIFPL
jgi:putative sterol carrier protein